MRKGKKVKPEDVEAARLAAEQAAHEYEAKRLEVQSRLEQIFSPWLDSIAGAIVDIEDAATAIGVDIRTEVTAQSTLKGLRAKEAELAKAQEPHRKAIKSLAASVGKLETKLTTIQTRLVAAQPPGQGAASGCRRAGPQARKGTDPREVEQTRPSRRRAHPTCTRAR